jgi:hypothetical protein
MYRRIGVRGDAMPIIGVANRDLRPHVAIQKRDHGS